MKTLILLLVVIALGALLTARKRLQAERLSSLPDIEPDYVDGFGNALYFVHPQSPDCDEGCVIHNPTDPNKDTFPPLWRGDRSMMERVCPHGIGHPDRDQIRYWERTLGEAEARAQATHACDGCCGVQAEGE